MTQVPFWRDRTVLVTGATGLLGGWLLQDLLRREASVTCLVRDGVPGSLFHREGLGQRVSVVHGDVRDQALLERVLGEYETDIVFHLAAQTIVTIANRNPAFTLDSNIRGTWSLLEACRRSPTVGAVVLASSDKAYGAHGAEPYDETLPLRGRHPYDVSKSCADLIAASYAATFGVPVAITRCGNLYGGGDLNWNRIVPGTIRSILRDERPVIRSDGTFVRDYFHVEDASAAYMMLAERLRTDAALRGEAFNFSNEEPRSVRELVDAILRVAGSELVPDVRGAAANEIPFQCLKAEKARKVLGWRSSVSLDEGLQRTLTWYRGYFGVNG